MGAPHLPAAVEVMADRASVRRRRTEAGGLEKIGQEVIATMDYSFLARKTADQTSRIGLIGATRGYGYTLLSQMTKVDCLRLRVMCARHVDACVRVLEELGYPTERVRVCENAEQVKAAPADAIMIVSDYTLVMESDIDSLVECTGNTTVGADAAMRALKKGINVYMVSKETDSVCGPLLNQAAAENGAVYALVNGDQPRNLLDLYSWAKLCGLEVIAAGKSSEYDFVWDCHTGLFSYTTEERRFEESIPGLSACWRYQGTQTLEERQRLLEAYTGVISADLCEMNLVSNVTGLVPASPTMHYPIAKISELADVFIPKEDGGILERTGVIDVFLNLRAPDEASFAGGEFVIVRCENDAVWELLKGKGHVVSRNGKYACLYFPYHFMGVETPASIILGDFAGIGSHPECRQVSIMVGVAQRDLPKGTPLKVAGHHHEIQGLTPQLLERAAADTLAPFYLLDGCVLLRDVKAGEAIACGAVDIEGLYPYQLYRQGLALPPV